MNLKDMKTSNPAMSKFESQAMSLGPVDGLLEVMVTGSGGFHKELQSLEQHLV